MASHLLQNTGKQNKHICMYAKLLLSMVYHHRIKKKHTCVRNWCFEEKKNQSPHTSSSKTRDFTMRTIFYPAALLKDGCALESISTHRRIFSSREQKCVLTGWAETSLLSKPKYFHEAFELQLVIHKWRRLLEAGQCTSHRSYPPKSTIIPHGELPSLNVSHLKKRHEQSIDFPNSNSHITEET